MSTNSKSEKRTKRRKARPPIFVPGCTKCGEVHMSLECGPAAPTAPIPVKTEIIGGQDNNNNAQQKNRNGAPPRRARAPRDNRQRPTRPSPPAPSNATRRSTTPSSSNHLQSMPSLMRPPIIRSNPFSSSSHMDHRRNGGVSCSNSLMDHRRNGGVSSMTSSFSNSNNYHKNNNNRNPHPHHHRDENYRGFGGPGFGAPPPRRSRGGAPYYSALRPMKNVVPPNERHMQMLNDQLRRFSYGTEDMYQEMPMPTPPPSPMKLRLLKQLASQSASRPSLVLSPPPPPAPLPPKKTTINQVPVVPEGEMYIFRRQRIYDEHGKRVGEAKTTSHRAELTGDKIILVDLDEDLVF